MRRDIAVLTAAPVVLALAACGGGRGKPAPATPPAPAGSAPESPASAPQPPANSVAGIAWTIPPNWTVEGPRPMRAATYTVPQGGSCAVYYFGSDQGGSVEANVQRWAGQFEGSPKPVTEKKTIASMPVTTVQINGTYTSPGGPMMQSQGKEEGYRLMGAIVEGPEGSVFFKCTGPKDAMTAAKPGFDDLLSSLHRQ
jgi:hypothetical protein